jgi:outer membrane lipoprotein-sorting protein
MDALEIIDNLKKTYAGLETYRDFGVTVATDALTSEEQAPRQHFETVFKRPQYYRCACRYELPELAAEAEREHFQALIATDGVLWSDGETSKHYTDSTGAVEVMPDTAHLFGPSLDPIFKGKAQAPDLIARLLMPAVFKDYDQFPLAKEYWSVIGEGTVEVDGHECWQIAQDLMIYKETLWIDADSFVLRKQGRDIDYSFLGHARVKTLLDAGSKMVRLFYKQFPDVATAVIERGPRHYRTTFSTIVINQALSDEQLAFKQAD